MSHTQPHMLTAWQSRLPRFIRQHIQLRAIHNRHPTLYWMIYSGTVGVQCTRQGDLIEINALVQNLASCEFDFLNELTTLQTLRLPHCTGVDNRILRQLRNARRLESLQLNGSEVSGYGLKYLMCHESLISLDASSSSIGTTSVEDCQPDTSAEEIRTFGMCNIARFSALRTLELNCTHVGDVELEQIAQLPELEYLSLINTRVSDDGIQHLRGHRKLQTLLIGSPKVTDCGVDALKAKLPTDARVELLKNTTVVTIFRTSGES